MEEMSIAAQKAAMGKRLNLKEALWLYENADLLDLGAWARAAKERKSGKNVYYNINRHINLTNVCKSGCPLCAFACKAGDSRAFTLEVEDVERLAKTAAVSVPGLTEIHIVSALHPGKTFEYYVSVVKKVKEVLPTVHLKAFTPVEIVHFAEISGFSLQEVLEELQSAGLDSLPGGGAEILDDAVRNQICPNKATSEQWVTTIKTAHRLGIATNATMLYGHVETVEQRLQHLFALREIQDETHGFQAFVAFPFHPANTKFSDLKRCGSWEDLRLIALARLILDNVDHIKAFWMMLTMPVAQLSLAFGADDLDGTVGEEKIIHAAGAKTRKGATKQEIVQMIAETGYVPVERDTFYRPVLDRRKA